MCDWITDRLPTIEEVKDHDLAYATMRVKPLRGDLHDVVALMSGFTLRTTPWKGSCIAGPILIAWMPKPAAYNAKREAEESARLLLALKSGSDEKLRGCIESDVS